MTAMDNHGQDTAESVTAQRLQVGTGPDGEVVLAGEIDLYNAAQLRSAIRGTDQDRQAVTVDLSGVTYLDSAGLAVLFEQAHRQLRVLACAGSAVATLLRICGLSHVAEVALLPAAGRSDGEQHASR
jgi:anti-sigma B factor antagonist